jgi:hypothetical protein
MEEQLSGPKRFFRFAWWCAKYRFNAKLISKADYDFLVLIKEQNKEPEISFLWKCFPDAVKSLEEFAIRENKIMWSPETVGDHWHQHKGESPVKTATICEIKADKFLVICDDGTMIGVTNDFCLDLRVSESVYIHSDGIADKTDV